MRDSLALTVVLYAVVLAVWCLGSAARTTPRSVAFPVALGVLEAGVLGQAALDAVALIGGQHGREVATNAGYLIASVLLLPVTAVAVRLDRGRWGSAGLAVGCLLVAVVAVRLQQTLGAGRG